MFPTTWTLFLSSVFLSLLHLFFSSTSSTTDSRAPTMCEDDRNGLYACSQGFLQPLFHCPIPKQLQPDLLSVTGSGVYVV